MKTVKEKLGKLLTILLKKSWKMKDVKIFEIIK